MATDETKIQLLGSRIMVRLIEPPEKSKNSLLIIPKESRGAAYTGHVIACGPEQTNVCIGDIVAFSRHAGIPLRKSGQKEEVLILDDFEILLIASPFGDDEVSHRNTLVIADKVLLEVLEQENTNIVRVGYSVYTGKITIVVESKL